MEPAEEKGSEAALGEAVWIVDQTEMEMVEEQKGLGSGMKVETGGLSCFTKNIASIDEGPKSR